MKESLIVIRTRSREIPRLGSEWQEG